MSKPTPSLSRRRFLGGAAVGATALTLGSRRASAQAKPTITYWNGLTGADGKIMDELIDQFTRDTGIRMEQQRIVWADLYAKLQVAVPPDEYLPEVQKLGLMLGERLAKAGLALLEGRLGRGTGTLSRLSHVRRQRFEPLQVGSEGGRHAVLGP